MDLVGPACIVAQGFNAAIQVDEERLQKGLPGVQSLQSLAKIRMINSWNIEKENCVCLTCKKKKNVIHVETICSTGIKYGVIIPIQTKKTIYIYVKKTKLKFTKLIITKKMFWSELVSYILGHLKVVIDIERVAFHWLF